MPFPDAILSWWQVRQYAGHPDHPMLSKHAGPLELGGILGQIRPGRHRTARTDGLTLGGEQDRIVPPGAVSGYAALLPGAGLRRVARCSHQIMLERRGKTSRAI